MLNFKLILNEKLILQEASGDDLANKLKNDVNKLLPTGDEKELIRLFKTYLSAAYLGQTLINDDFGSFFNNIKDIKNKLYFAVAIRSYSAKEVFNFYKRHQNELEGINLNIIKQAINDASESKSLSYSQAEQRIKSKGEI